MLSPQYYQPDMMKAVLGKVAIYHEIAHNSNNGNNVGYVGTKCGVSSR